MSMAKQIVEKLLEAGEDIDAKDFVQATPRVPTTWGELKVGDVLFVPETGSFERIDEKRHGYGSSYQDERGNLVHDSGPALFCMFSQFSPAYAYGHYVQHLSAHPKGGLLGAEIVNVPDKSDEALWRLVDEEMYRNGITPERLQADRVAHQQRLRDRDAR